MTVIFQGAWNKNCNIDIINSVKNWHNGRIIFSTWQDENVPIVDRVEYIFLKDCNSGPVQNFRRQVIGLREALYKKNIDDNEIVLKIRSDISCPKNPLNYFSLEKCNDIFDYKVGISRIMTRDPNLFPWYISDWIWLGTAKDIKKIISINPDECEIIDNSTEATWAKAINKKYSSIKNPSEFLNSNYIILNISSDIGMSCANYPNQPEDHPYYIK